MRTRWSRGDFSTQYGPVREQWKDFDHSGPWRGQFHFPLAEHHDQRHARQAEPSIGPVALATERTGRFLDYFVGQNVDDVGLRIMLEFDNQVGARTPSPSSGCRRGSAAAASRTAGCSSSRAPARALQNQVVTALAQNFTTRYPAIHTLACMSMAATASRKTSASRLLNRERHAGVQRKALDPPATTPPASRAGEDVPVVSSNLRAPHIRVVGLMGRLRRPSPFARRTG
jgi:hypothetical protein